MFIGFFATISLLQVVVSLEITICPANSELGTVSLNLTAVDCSQSPLYIEANRMRILERKLVEFASIDNYFGNHSTCSLQNGEISPEVPIESTNLSFTDFHSKMGIAEYCFPELREWINEIRERTDYSNYREVACSGWLKLSQYISEHRCVNWRIMEVQP